MDSEQTLTSRLQETLTGWIDGLVQAIPTVVLAIALIAAAFLVAGLIRKGLRVALERLKLDRLAERMGLDRVLARLGITQRLSALLPRVVYFLLLLLFAQAAADALSVEAVSHAIGGFLAYLPNVLAAILLLLAGTWASRVAGATVARAASESGLDFADSVGRLVSTLLLFVFGLMALSQLQIDTDIVRIMTICALGGIALAFGLSFGLGTRDITRNILAGFYARKFFRAGEPIEIGGQKGVLKGITSTQTLIEAEGRTVSVSNAEFLEGVVKQ